MGEQEIGVGEEGGLGRERAEKRGSGRGVRTGVGGRCLEEGRGKKKQGWTEWKRRGRKQGDGSRKETLRGVRLYYPDAAPPPPVRGVGTTDQGDGWES